MRDMTGAELPLAGSPRLNPQPPPDADQQRPPVILGDADCLGGFVDSAVFSQCLGKALDRAIGGRLVAPVALAVLGDCRAVVGGVGHQRQPH